MFLAYRFPLQSFLCTKAPEMQNEDPNQVQVQKTYLTQGFGKAPVVGS